MSKIALLPLTKGLFALVDEEDYEWLSAFNWKVSFKGKSYYAQTYRVGYLHRLLMKPPNGKVVDHINGFSLDCRKKNLRICTVSENVQKQKSSLQRRRNKSSRYVGVSFKKRDGTWVMEITKNRIRIRKGGFKTAKEAAQAYDYNARKLFGKYATINFK